MTAGASRARRGGTGHLRAGTGPHQSRGRRLPGATLALAHAATGRLASAVQLAIDGVATANARRFCFVWLLDIQGSVLLAAQRVDEAASVATAALEMARAQAEQGHEARALLLLGVISGRQPAAVEASLGLFDAALALADRLRMRPLRARCHLARAEVLSRAGRHDQVRPSLAVAIEEFRAMEMKGWLRQAEALEATIQGSTFLRERSATLNGPGATVISRVRQDPNTV